MEEAVTAPETSATSTVTAPEGQTASAASQTTGQAPETGGKGTSLVVAPAPAEENFFDPESIRGKPELESAYKQMRNAFTKKMQGLSKDRDKVAAYDAFQSDPIAAMQKFAKQHGYSLTRAEAAQAANDAGHGLDNWQPQTWNEVMLKARENVMGEVKQLIAPLIQNIQKVTTHTIEQQLTEIDPGWQVYEDEMRTNITAHPSLVNDIPKLYRLSVPEEVLTSRAVQQALKKLEDKAKGSQPHGGQHSARSTPAPKQAKSFQEAVDLARSQLAGR